MSSRNLARPRKDTIAGSPTGKGASVGMSRTMKGRVIYHRRSFIGVDLLWFSFCVDDDNDGAFRVTRHDKSFSLAWMICTRTTWVFLLWMVTRLNRRVKSSWRYCLELPTCHAVDWSHGFCTPQWHTTINKGSSQKAYAMTWMWEPWGLSQSRKPCF
jgi:hypothetical protein